MRGSIPSVRGRPDGIVVGAHAREVGVPGIRLRPLERILTHLGSYSRVLSELGHMLHEDFCSAGRDEVAGRTVRNERFAAGGIGAGEKLRAPRRPLRRRHDDGRRARALA